LRGFWGLALAAGLMTSGGCGAVRQVASIPFVALDTAHNLSKLAVPIAEAEQAAVGLVVDLVKAGAESAVTQVAEADNQPR